MDRGVRTAVTAVLVALLTLSAVPASAANNPSVAAVYAVGRSRIQGADMSASQSAAVSDSLVSAVAAVLTDLIPPQTAVGNFQVISEAVLARPEQFIIDYKLLTESIYDKNHRVMVKVNISMKRLTRALNAAGIPVSQKQYPRILFCIAEQWAGDLQFRYWWSDRPAAPSGPAADALSDVFKRQGYPAVDPGRPAAGSLPPDLSPQAAVSLGRQFGADVVVAGRAVAQETPSSNGAAPRSFSASVSVQAYSVGSGEPIAQARRVHVATAGGPQSGSREAITRAARLAGEDLNKQVARAWFAEGAGASQIEVFVEGISGNVASFVRFRGALSTMPGVDSVQRREMQHDTAVLVVSYQGNVKALADAIRRQTFDTFGLDLYEAEDRRIRLQLMPNQTP